MSDSAPEVTTVIVEDAPDTTADSSGDAPDVVVVDTGDGDGGGDAVEAELVEQTVDNAVDVALLAQRVADLESRVFAAEANAAIAEEVAEEALEVAAETPVAVVEEVDTDGDGEDDDVRVHFVHRSFGQLLHRD